MDLIDRKKSFIEIWGKMSTQWGINPTMAHLHALLLVSSQPLTSENIMNELHISRGSVCENIRNLIDWELAYKKNLEGDRKDFYVAEKDIWIVMRMIIKHRKRKELDPVMDSLLNLSQIECEDKESVEFKKVLQDLYSYSNKTSQVLEKISTGKNANILSVLIKLMT